MVGTLRFAPPTECERWFSAFAAAGSMVSSCLKGLPKPCKKFGRAMMRVSAVLLVAISSMFASAALAQAPKLAVEEMMVPSSDPGIEIYVRNKRPADMASFRPERTVLYVHGATYPSSTAFDLQLDGMSWMDYIAARGYDVYLLDLRGYGKSTRPKEMSEDPKASPPIVRG